MIEKPEDLSELLARMSAPIAELLREMMNRRPQSWLEAYALRDRLIELNKTATTNEEQACLSFAFTALMDGVEKNELIEADKLERFRQLRKSDYLVMLTEQAREGELVDPDRLEEITRREVVAGRLAADDEFRKYALAGSQVLGRKSKSASGNWVRRMFSRGANTPGS